MKFAAHLSAHITPEWRKQYISYEELKQQLYDAVEQAPSVAKVNANILARYFVEADETFFSNCEKELSKVNTFYSEKIAEAMRKFASLQHDLAAAYSMDVIEKPSFYKKNSRKNPPKKPSSKKLRKLEVAFSEFYLSLVLLQNYQTLNYSGFRKILKKHDKLFSVKNGEYWRRENVDCAPFYVNKETDRLIEETENVVTTYLEEGNRQRAMKRLHIPPIGEHQSIWTTFNLGLLMGTFFSLLGILIFIVIFKAEHGDYRIALRLYRGTFFIVLFLFLCGLNVYGWRTSGVNHILIFEINPRNHLSEQHILEISMFFGILWMFSVLGFIFGDKIGVSPFVNPLLLIFAMVLFLLNPSKTLFHEARYWFLRVMGRIMFAPFFKVNFADFWIAEQLTSLVPVFLDIHFLICFYLGYIVRTNEEDFVENVKFCVDHVSILQPMLTCLPAWFRLAQCLRRYYDTKQCFPHILSAINYLLMIFVIFFAYWNVKVKRSEENHYADSNFHFYLWMISVILSTTFIFLWDVKIDWGLFSGSALENKFLREQIIYSSEVYYFAAIAVNFVLRFFWAFSLSFLDFTYPNGDILVVIITPLEILRRFMWNFFRLENEHLNNCGEFRAIRDISVIPLETIDRDQDVLLRMMDEQDGVTNRRRKPIYVSTKEEKIKIA